MRRPAARVGQGLLATMTVGVLLIISSITVAIWTGFASADFLGSLDLRWPALSRALPVIGPAPQRLARRVVVVMIDGLRLDTSYGRSFLDRLRDDGIDTSARSHFPSMSRPNYVSIVTGVEPRWSGVRTNRFSSPVLLDSMMARARAAGMRVAYAAREATGIPLMFGDELDEGGLTPWAGGMERTVQNALLHGDDLVLVWITDVDNAGHEFGGDSVEYRMAARAVNERLEQMFAPGAWEGELDLSRDAIVVLADHGHIDRGGHGGIEPEVMEVPLILAGAGIRRDAVVRNAGIRDVAPTVCALLGLPPPGHALGRVLVEALAYDPATAERIALADVERRAQLMPTLELEQYEAKLNAWQVRARRAGAFIALLAAMLALAIVAQRRGWIHLDRRGALIALPLFPLTFYGMLLTFENWLSPSMVPATGDVTPKLFLYGAVAAVANLAAAWYALSVRQSPAERLAAAAGHVLVGMIMGIAPAGLAWTIAGPTVALELPGPDALLLPPVTYAGVCCFAASAAIIMTVEYVVFLARASDPRRYPPPTTPPSAPPPATDRLDDALAASLGDTNPT